MVRKAIATIKLRFLSQKEINIIQKSLRPEVESSPTRRSEVHITSEGRTLTLIFEAEDTTALRASINSYLNWLQLLNEICGILKPKKS